LLGFCSVRKNKKKKRIVRRVRVGVKSKFGASVPTDFDRQKRIFDYVKWHEINRKESVALFKSKFSVQTKVLAETEVRVFFLTDFALS
jgi:hypothetical protein